MGGGAPGVGYGWGGLDEAQDNQMEGQTVGQWSWGSPSVQQSRGLDSPPPRDRRTPPSQPGQHRALRPGEGPVNVPQTDPAPGPGGAGLGVRPGRSQGEGEGPSPPAHPAGHLPQRLPAGRVSLTPGPVDTD